MCLTFDVRPYRRSHERLTYAIRETIYLTNVSRRMKRNYEDIAPANWVIPSNCIAWEREIGSGAFATTYEVRYDGQLMADDG